jgi:hypothetical protein
MQVEMQVRHFEGPGHHDLRAPMTDPIQEEVECIPELLTKSMRLIKFIDILAMIIIRNGQPVPAGLKEERK